MSETAFPEEETQRRFVEICRRGAGAPGTFDLKTGQNYAPPYLSEDELKRRGYPCEPWWQEPQKQSDIDVLNRLKGKKVR